MTFWQKVKVITSSIWSYVEPIVKVFISAAGPILAEAALSAVKATAQNMSGATDSQKRDAAYRLITDKLKQQGIELGTSVVNMALEAAVQKLKNP